MVWLRQTATAALLCVCVLPFGCHMVVTRLWLLLKQNTSRVFSCRPPWSLRSKAFRIDSDPETTRYLNSFSWGSNSNLFQPGGSIFPAEHLWLRVTHGLLWWCCRSRSDRKEHETDRWISVGVTPVNLWIYHKHQQLEHTQSS